MNILGFLFLIIFALTGLAQSIQVPENCLNKISPCLFRTEDDFFEFKHDNQKVILIKEGIVKINFDENHNNFELLEGRMSLLTQKKNSKQITVNHISILSNRIMVNRISNKISFLDLKDFTLKEYILETALEKPKLIRSGFINKKDFVEFTRYYFKDLNQYKKFLVMESKLWKLEFNKQNENQSKVLERSIALEKASVPIETKDEAKEKAIKEAQLKRIKEEFFYRTFER